MTCSIDGCEKAAKRGGLCWAHVKRRRRAALGETPLPADGPLRDYGLPSAEQIVRAALRLADCPDEAVAKVRRLVQMHALKASRKRARKFVHNPPDTSGRG